MRNAQRTAAVLLLLAAVLVVVGVVARLTRGDGGPAGGDAAAAAAAARPDAAKRALRGRSFTLAWAGDTMLGSASRVPPDQGRPLFADVRSLLRRADIAAGNLEGVLTTATASKCPTPTPANCFAFRADPGGARTLAEAGFAIVNLANNHAWDYGEAGQRETIAALDAAGVRWTGTPGTFTVLRRNGIRIGFVGYAPYPWAPTLQDTALAQGLVRYADTQADVVVAFIHAGAEGREATHTPEGIEMAYGEDRGDTRGFAHALVDAGADLVLGSGPHVIRGVERYRDRLIAYSLGNFAGWHNFSDGGTYDLSGLLTLKVDGEGRTVSGRWQSLRLQAPGIPRRDPTNASAALAAELSRADFGRAAALRRDGRVA